MQLCVEHGHQVRTHSPPAPGTTTCWSRTKRSRDGGDSLQIVALANLAPQPGAADELDSYMYQTVGHQLVTAYAQCMALPLFRCHTSGRSHSQARHSWHSGLDASPGDR